MKRRLLTLLVCVLVASSFYISASCAEYPQDNFSMGKEYYEKSQYKEAISEFNKVILKDPKHAEAYALKAISLGKLELFDEAVITLNEALDIDKSNTEVYYYLGYLLYRLEKYNDALIALNRSIELNPQYYHSYIIIGRIQAIKGNYIEAYKGIDKALSINPRSEAAYYYKALSFREQKLFEDALKCLDRMLEINPYCNDVYNEIGINLMNMGKEEEALAAYKKEIENHPENARPYCNIGTLYDMKSEMEMALEWYIKALTVDSNMFEAGYNKGYVYTEMGRLQDALTCFGELIKKHPQNELGYVGMFTTCRDMENFDEFLKHIDMLLKINPDSFIGNLYKGGILVYNKHDSGGIEFLDKAIEVNPNDGMPYYFEAVYYAQVKNKTLCAYLIKQALIKDLPRVYGLLAHDMDTKFSNVKNSEEFKYAINISNYIMDIKIK